MATVIGCGIFGVPFWRFLPSLTLGAFVYILLYALLGYFVGPTVLQLLEGIHLLLGVFGSLVPLVILLVALRLAHLPVWRRDTQSNLLPNTAPSSA